MLYHGTDIDGVSLDPETLAIRGLSITEIIGRFGYAEAILLILTGEAPQAETAAALEAGLVAWMASQAPDDPMLDLAARAARAGAGMAQAVTAGLMGLAAKLPAEGLEFDSLPKGAAEGLAVGASIPALLAAWQAARAGTPCPAPADAAGDSFARSSIRLLTGKEPDPAAATFLEDVVATWTGGFGYLPPSIMIPRVSIGTGVPLYHALAAGFAAAGPMHIGATLGATQMIVAALRSEGPPETRIAKVFEHVRSQGHRIGGFGHPLLVTDPRPPRLRERAEELGLDHPALEIFDAACRVMARDFDLRPNIDFMTGTAMVMAGITDPGVAGGMAMMGRTAGMLAHVIERRDRPPFGVNSTDARKYLDTVPKGWI